MCQPKSHGGCGLKDINGQNYAFLMKLVHAIHTRPNLLWVQVLRSKYDWKAGRPRRHRNLYASHLWKSLLAVWDDAVLGQTWKVGNGKRVKLWADNWIGVLGPLSNLSLCPLKEEELQKTINDLVSQEAQWKWCDFQGKLPHDSLAHFMQTRPPQNQNHDDCLYWLGNPTFSVKTAYDLIMQDRWDDENKIWHLA